jgi:hypothetical protein
MAISKEIVDQQLANVGDFDQWFTKKEIKYLPEVMDQDEVIQAITSGLLDGNTWLIVATQKSVLFLDKGMVFGLKQLEFPIKNITSISHKTGLIFGQIELTVSGANKKIDQVTKKDVVKFAKVLSNLFNGENSPPTATEGSSDDILSKLQRLSKLKEQGILNDEEFEKQKQLILMQS